MLALKSPKGLGDALYLRAIALHMLERGQSPVIHTLWPDAFSDLPITVKPISEEERSIQGAFYCLHCRIPEPRAMDQFEMCCAQAGLVDPVDFKMGWKVRDTPLTREIKRIGKPILVYQPPKHAKNEEQELVSPRREAFNAFLDDSKYFRVRIGSPKHVDAKCDAPFDLDLVGKTSIHDAFDIGALGDVFFGEPSFLLVMAEAMDKPVTCMFTRRAQNSGHWRACNATAERIFHKRHLITTVYDE